MYMYICIYVYIYIYIYVFPNIHCIFKTQDLSSEYMNRLRLAIVFKNICSSPIVDKPWKTYV